MLKKIDFFKRICYNNNVGKACLSAFDTYRIFKEGKMKTDIEIAKEAKMLPITEIAKDLGIEDEELELYGRYKAKINDSFLKRTESRKNGKLILVTAINPTPAGEGATSVG